MPPYTVALVGPDDLLWGALRSIIRSLVDLRVVLDLQDGTDPGDVAERLAASRPDAIVLGRAPRGCAALPLLTDLRARCPASKILLLADGVDRDELRAFAAIGIDGYLFWQDLDAAILGHCLPALLCGGDLVITSRAVVADFLHQQGTRGRSGGSAPALTERERLVLRGLAAGLTQEQIAQTTALGLRTIKRTTAALAEKLQAPSPFVLGVRARDLGLIAAED